MSKRTEAGVMRQIIRVCKAAGWEPTTVDNGAELVDVENEDQLITEATATGQAYVFLRNEDSRRGWLFFVLGNCPEEVLNNYTTNLEDAVGPYLKILEL